MKKLTEVNPEIVVEDITYCLEGNLYIHRFSVDDIDYADAPYREDSPFGEVKDEDMDLPF